MITCSLITKRVVPLTAVLCTHLRQIHGVRLERRNVCGFFDMSSYESMDANVDRPITLVQNKTSQHLWIDMQFCRDIYEPKRMNPWWQPDFSSVSHEVKMSIHISSHFCFCGQKSWKMLDELSWNLVQVLMSPPLGWLVITLVIPWHFIQRHHQVKI